MTIARLLAFFFLMFAAPVGANEPAAPTASRDVVLWLSIDGFRSDYLERADTPNLHRLMKQGVYSLELAPNFPAITFPSHISQATGVGVAKHGIPSNTFYDAAADFTHRYPWYGRLLEAEPIWLTSSRQGVRTAALDWPLSHSQRGKVTAAYFETRFDGSKSDRERLERIIEVWDKDDASEPLRLIMGYIVGTDTVGHERGPDSRQVLDVAHDVDALLGPFLASAVKTFEKHRRGDEQLYIVLTTDHGMSPVHTLVHLGHLAGVEKKDGITLSTGGNVGDIHFGKDIPERDKAIAAAIADVATQSYAKAYKREDLPKEWDLAHPTRVGDVVVVLDRGYTFTRGPKGVSMPVTEKGPLGMHGYDPKSNAEMLGPMIVWRYPKKLPPKKLGPVSALQLHPTVAKLLGIQPSDVAKGEPVALEAAE
jgi:predicted AlkP superfamily pyrophosphatase or phosphodiesterase